MKTKNFYALLFCLFMFTVNFANANNLTVSNFTLTGRNVTSHYIMVKFDIRWENSWRTSSAPNNWDAAWIFVKYRIGTSEWQHAWLNNVGHINPAGSTINTGLLASAPFNETTNPGMGVFIYRDADGIGTFSKTGLQLRWNYGANGVADNDIIDIRLYAIEMVYVPQGSFYIGSGGEIVYGGFYKYPTTTNPYQVAIESGQITIGPANNNLYYNYYGDKLGPIPASFPKGFNPFYCMKYEISQQGYVDFLNNLTQSQADNRKYTGSVNRYAITGSSVGSYSSGNPNVACNFLKWADLAAYLDWSGLRPMSEIEFEKACRGTLTPLPGEFAWGSTVYAQLPYALSNPGSYSENISTNYSTAFGNNASGYTITNNINGPLRVGIFASNILNTGRQTSGATYYGIMEMSGNLEEATVTVGSPTGRAFTAANGNGLLNPLGNANVTTWPNIYGDGAGYRGGCVGYGDEMMISDRRYSSIGNYDRMFFLGGRGVRTVTGY